MKNFLMSSLCLFAVACGETAAPIVVDAGNDARRDTAVQDAGGPFVCPAGTPGAAFGPLPAAQMAPAARTSCTATIATCLSTAANTEAGFTCIGTNMMCNNCITVNLLACTSTTGGPCRNAVGCMNACVAAACGSLPAAQQQACATAALNQQTGACSGPVNAAVDCALENAAGACSLINMSRNACGPEASDAGVDGSVTDATTTDATTTDATTTDSATTTDATTTDTATNR